jgi:HAD superfamily hydrolase (TIGR01509 family)
VTPKGALVVDWGGVLMITVDHSPRLRWDQRLGLAPGSVENAVFGIDDWRAAQRGEIPPADYWQTVGKHLKLSADQLAAFRVDFFSMDQPNIPLVDLLRRWHTAGLAVGLLSNNSADLHVRIDDLGLADLFDAQVISADTGILKPDPAAYAAILSRLNVSASQSFFIDDFAENVEAARAAGMRAYHYRPGCEIDLAAHVDCWLNESVP